MRGERNGEEGNAEPSVDEGRAAHAQDAHGCEDKDGDCAKAEAERRCDVSSDVKAGRDVGTEVDPVGDFAESPELDVGGDRGGNRRGEQR